MTAPDELRIRLDIVPPRSTAQGKGVFVVKGKPRFFTKAKQKKDQTFLGGMLMEHVPKASFDVPISVSLLVVYPFNVTEKKLARMWGIAWHPVKPDLDNIEKGILDVMTRLGFWRDDSLICVKHSTKLRGELPRLCLVIRKLKAIELLDAETLGW